MKNGAKYLRPDALGKQYGMVETNRNYCLTDFCRRTVSKATEKSPYCYHCRFLKFKNKNPLRYSFGNLRRRAAQRGKDFSLTFEQYRSFCLNTDYHKLKGKTSLSLSIDRIKNSEGYHASNIAAISLRENSRKQFVPYFARQMENIAYKPSDEELNAVAEKMSE
ncbi:MAG: hypothetical protein WCL30_06665 [Pseudomonadota bacterium]